jgi:Uncharacterized conserved protein
MPIDYSIHKIFHYKALDIKYKPISLLELFTKVRKVSDMLVDVAFFVYLTKDKEATNHLIELTKLAETLITQANIHTALIVRNVKDAKNVIGIYRYSAAMEKIIDSLLDIAYIGLTDHSPKEDIAQALLLLSEEVIIKIRANKNVAVNVSEIHEKYPLDVILQIHKDKPLVYPSEKISENDILYIRGLKEHINKFLVENGYEKLTEPIINEDVKQVLLKIIFLRDAIKVLLDLSHYVLITGNKEIGDEIDEIEMFIDTYHLELMEEIIKRPPTVHSITNLSLLILISKLENIADATEEIALISLTDEEIRKIFGQIYEAIGERCISLKVSKNVSLQSLLSNIRKYGSYIPAIKKGNEWLIQTKFIDREINLNEGDIILVIYPKEFEEEVNSILKNL